MRIRSVEESIVEEEFPELDRRTPIDRRNLNTSRRWKAGIGSGTKYRIHKRRSRNHGTPEQTVRHHHGIHNRRSRRGNVAE